MRNTTISALIGVVTFMVPVILSGTFGDYREIERVPRNLASSARVRVMMRTVDADLSAPLSARSRPRPLPARARPGTWTNTYECDRLLFEDSDVKD